MQPKVAMVLTGIVPMFYIKKIAAISKFF